MPRIVRLLLWILVVSPLASAQQTVCEPAALYRRVLAARGAPSQPFDAFVVTERQVWWNFLSRHEYRSDTLVIPSSNKVVVWHQPGVSIFPNEVSVSDRKAGTFRSAEDGYPNNPGLQQTEKLNAGADPGVSVTLYFRERPWLPVNPVSCTLTEEAAVLMLKTGYSEFELTMDPVSLLPHTIRQWTRDRRLTVHELKDYRRVRGMLLPRTHIRRDSFRGYSEVVSYTFPDHVSETLVTEPPIRAPRF